MKFESFVQKASRAAYASVIRHRYFLNSGTRFGEEMARVVAKAVRDAFKVKEDKTK